MPSLTEHVLTDPDRLLPHQRDTILSQAAYTIIHGGVGAAKTRACLWKVFLRAKSAPGQTILIGALTQRHLEDVVLDPWFDEFPRGSYHFHKSDHRITVPSADGSGKSTILLRSLQRRDMVATIRGLTLTGYYLAQAELLPEKVFHELEQRMRDQGNLHLHFRLFDANAGSLKHWIYRFLVDRQSPEFLGENLVDAIHVTSMSNPWAYTDDQIQSARKTMPEVQFRREYLGIWCDEAGLVYPTFEVGPAPPDPDRVLRFWIGLDPGGGANHPTGVVWIGEVVDPLGPSKFWVLDERELSDFSLQELPDVIRTVNDRWGAEKFEFCVIDWSGIMVKRFLEADGIPVVFPANDNRWRRVNEGCRLTGGALTSGDLIISPECRRTQRDLGHYVWSADGVEPDKSRYDPHLLDALRYCWIRVGRRR